MKTCYYCNRQISNGIMILRNGVKCVCCDEDDQICSNISDVKEGKHLLRGGTHIKCSCGNSFYRGFPILTEPGCDDCPFCGITHRNDNPLVRYEEDDNPYAGCFKSFFTK